MLGVAPVGDRLAGAIRPGGTDLGGLALGIGGHAGVRVLTRRTYRSRHVDGAIRADRSPPDVTDVVANLCIQLLGLAVEQGPVADRTRRTRSLPGDEPLAAQEVVMQRNRRVVEQVLLRRGTSRAIQILDDLGLRAQRGLPEGAAAALVCPWQRPVHIVSNADTVEASLGERVSQGLGHSVGVRVGRNSHDASLEHCCPLLGIRSLDLAQPLLELFELFADVGSRLALSLERRRVYTRQGVELCLDALDHGLVRQGLGLLDLSLRLVDGRIPRPGDLAVGHVAGEHDAADKRQNGAQPGHTPRGMRRAARQGIGEPAPQGDGPHQPEHEHDPAGGAPLEAGVEHDSSEQEGQRPGGCAGAGAGDGGDEAADDQRDDDGQPAVREHPEKLGPEGEQTVHFLLLALLGGVISACWYQ